MIPQSIAAFPAAGLALQAGLLLLIFLPGLSLLRLARHPARSWDRLALAGGLGLAFWPLAFLWTDLIGLEWSSGRVWIVLLLCLTAALWTPLRRRVPSTDAIEAPPSQGSHRAQRANISPAGVLGAGLLPLLLLIAAYTRWSAASSLVLPPWVDGLHHSLVVQLFLDQAGLPAHGLPYLEMPRFYYHFGFHALAAAAAWITGAAPSTLVLALGQLLSALILLPIYTMALRATGSRNAAGLAAALPASLFYLPAYYLAWSRFTQLAGLVLLPVAWILLEEASRPGQARPRRIALASIAASGLLLIHLRVFSFFLLGAAILAAYRLFRARRALLALAASTAGALLLAAPWILGRLLPAAAAMSRAASDWIRASEEIASSVAQAPPAWLFTWQQNGFWIRMALIGLLAGILRGRRSAIALALWLLASLLLVAPGIVGLEGSWILPPFSLAITLFLPVAFALAMGLASLERGLHSRGLIFRLAPALLSMAALAAWRSGALADPRLDPTFHLLLYLLAAIGLAWAENRASFDARNSAAARLEDGPGATARLAPGTPPETGNPPAGGRRSPSPFRAHHVTALLPIPILIIALAAAPRIRSVASDETIIATEADLVAADWIREQTPPEARFLIASAHWHLGTWRGLDGGYWLPLTAGRATSMPAALYTYGPVEDVIRITEIAERASLGDALDDASLDALMDDALADRIYIGPASADHPEAFTAARLARHPGLVEAYAAGGVHIFERRARSADER